jgi:ComEC/Rec2-related protein
MVGVFALRHPFVPLALAYVAGVLLGWRCPLSLPLLYSAAFLCVVTALVRPAWRGVLAWPLLVLLGWTNMVYRSAVVSPHDLRVLATGKAELLVLRVRLTETPSFRVFVRDEQESWRSHAVVEVEALKRRGEWQPASGLVAVVTPGIVATNFFTGRAVELTGILRAPPGPPAADLFDYRAFLAWQGIYFQLHCADPNDWRLIEAAGGPVTPPWTDRFLTWSQRVLARGLPVEDEELRLLWAMTLGWKTALTDEVSEPFMRSGTMHIFAISGLHIALIAGILVAVLRAMQLPRGACGAIIVPVIWFYTAATGWQSSAIRSTIMMTVIIVGWSVRRPSNLLNSLAASGFIILIWEPTQLFQASFQLSLFVVLSIALLMPPFEAFRQRCLQTDPLLPDELRPRWRRWLDPVIHAVTTSLATSLAAWFGSLPLIAYYFHLFTPGSLLANLIVVPLSSLALMCNLGALVCGDWLPWVTDCFNHSGWLFMRGMIWFSKWSITLPGAFWHIRTPTLFEFCAFYTGIFFLVMGWLWSPTRRVLAWSVLGVLTMVWLGAEWQTRDEVRLTVLGHSGNAIFCDRPGNREDLLVDCGSESGVKFLVEPFLHAQGLDTLANVVITHADQRHVTGFNRIDAEFHPGLTFTSHVRSRSPAYREVLKQLEAAPARWQRVAAGDALARWEVLHPAKGSKIDRADDDALVLRSTLHGLRVLLLSELGAAGQRALRTNQADLRADVVIAGTPDQGEPLNAELLAAIRPRLIVVADSEYPVSKRAKPVLIGRLKATGVPTLQLAKTGTLTLRFASDGLRVASVAGEVLAVLTPTVGP